MKCCKGFGCKAMTVASHNETKELCCLPCEATGNQEAQAFASKNIANSPRLPSAHFGRLQVDDMNVMPKTIGRIIWIPRLIKAPPVHQNLLHETDRKAAFLLMRRVARTTSRVFKAEFFHRETAP